MAKDKHRIVLEVEGELKKYFKNRAAQEDRSVNYFISNILQNIKDKEESANETN